MRKLTITDSSLLEDVQGIPSEIAQWWRDAHRWDREKGVYATVEYELVSGGKAVDVGWVTDPDYKLWRVLGFASDVVLAVIAMLIVVLVLGAF